jgi:hypothetical protein
MEEDSEILEPEEIEALVEHLPPRDGTIDKLSLRYRKEFEEFVSVPLKKEETCFISIENVWSRYKNSKTTRDACLGQDVSIQLNPSGDPVPSSFNHSEKHATPPLSSNNLGKMAIVAEP